MMPAMIIIIPTYIFPVGSVINNIFMTQAMLLKTP